MVIDDKTEETLLKVCVFKPVLFELTCSQKIFQSFVARMAGWGPSVSAWPTHVLRPCILGKEVLAVAVWPGPAPPGPASWGHACKGVMWVQGHQSLALQPPQARPHLLRLTLQEVEGGHRCGGGSWRLALGAGLRRRPLGSQELPSLP